MREDLAVLLLKKLSLLPFQEVRLELNNELSKSIIDLSIQKFSNKIVVLLPLKPLEENPCVNDLPNVGVVAIIQSRIVLPNNNYRVVLKGLNRVQISNFKNYALDAGILISNVKKLYLEIEETNEIIALKRKLIMLLNQYISSSSEVSNSILSFVDENKSLDELTDKIVNFLHFSFEKKLYYMNEFSEIKRAKKLIKDINVELEISKLNSQLDREIQSEFEIEQKEYILKQKIAKLNSELGISSSKDERISQYYDKIADLNICEKTKNKFLSELKKIESSANNNPETALICNYLDTVLSLPYETSSKEETKQPKILSYMNKTHFGLNDIKDRICDYALLKAINPDLVNPIICLIGPPGVGKSTIAKSISGALKREYYKISVGGLNDSSELVGHTRAYLGARPGKVIQAILRCQTNNPIILIDEVDKMVKDYKGDPSSVLLDILDSNQNKNFIDNYIEEPFDISKVLFILTANDESKIPYPLKDRLEIIHVESYTIYEKKDIAVNYLIPNICIKYNYRKVKFSDNVILFIIKNYTLENGVRELNRLLDKIIRKLIINDIKESKINETLIPNILGLPLYDLSVIKETEGSSNSIGIHPLGGFIINIQCSLIDDKEKLYITGDTGDQLKDSVMIAFNYLKSSKILIDYNESFHIHFNSIYPLEGGSASLSIITAIHSAFIHQIIPSNIAFTGSLDLYGNICKVSSIKEKIITAYNNNIKTIYIPQDNLNDINNVPDFIKTNLHIIPVSTYQNVVTKLFAKKKKS